ncbi:MAG TPA: uroporphyrinogen decarboxylase family protein, partial [bacterium]|nr:uroporphyrinogen decarboxylase family protein [bacterium]
ADFALLTLEHPSLVRRYLDTVRDRQAACLDAILPRLGVPAILNISGAEYAIPPLMGPAAFRELVQPYEAPLIDLIHRHGLLVYYHCHGKVRRYLPGFIAMGADGIHPLEPPGSTGDCDLAEVKKEFGRDICLIGNVQYDTLVRATPRDVEMLVKEVVETGRVGGGFILSPSCAPYHNPLPPEVERNIMAFIDAGLRYGAA